MLGPVVYFLRRQSSGSLKRKMPTLVLRFPHDAMAVRSSSRAFRICHVGVSFSATVCSNASCKARRCPELPADGPGDGRSPAQNAAVGAAADDEGMYADTASAALHEFSCSVRPFSHSPTWPEPHLAAARAHCCCTARPESETTTRPTWLRMMMMMVVVMVGPTPKRAG